MDLDLDLQRSETDLDPRQEQARLNFHRANTAALEERQKTGELIETEHVAGIVGDEYASVRAKLLAIPSKAAPQVIGLSTVAVKAMLDNLVREALEELCADTV